MGYGLVTLQSCAEDTGKKTISGVIMNLFVSGFSINVTFYFLNLFITFILK